MISRHRHEPPRWLEFTGNLIAITVTLAGVTTAGSLAWHYLNPHGTVICLLGTAGATIAGAIPGWLITVILYRWLP